MVIKMPKTIDERQALALLRSGKSVTELVRDHGKDLEVRMDFGRGLVAAAHLDLIEDLETGETKVRATASGVDQHGRKVEATLTSTVADAESLIAEAIESNAGKLALAAVEDFISARGGSRKVAFARRFGTGASAGVGGAKAQASKALPEVIMEPDTSTEVDEFSRDPINAPNVPYHQRKWR